MKYLIFILILCNTCLAQKRTKQVFDEDKEKLILSIFENYTNHKRIKVQNKILIKSYLNGEELVNWTDVLKQLGIISLRNTNVKTKRKHINLTDLFSENDLKHMQTQGLESKIKFWDELLDFPIVKDKKFIIDLYVSYPVFDIKKEYAIVYFESPEYGRFFIYKKQDTVWKLFASALVWIA